MGRRGRRARAGGALLAHDGAGRRAAARDPAHRRRGGRGRVYFCTGLDEQKGRNLEHNDRVALTTGNNAWASGLDVVVEGTAVRITDDEALQRLADAWEAKYGSEWHWEVARRDVPPLATVAVPPCSGSSQRRSSRSRRTRTARRRFRSERPRLIGVHPHLPAAGSSVALVVEVVGPTPAELGMSHVADAAEHRRDPAPRPSERVLDLGERSRIVRRLGELAEQRAHQVAGAVVEASDLAGVGHDVLRSVLAGQSSTADGHTNATTHGRWAGLSGIAGALMFAVGNVIWALDMPEDGTAVPEVVDFYADTADRIVIGGSLSLLSIAVFLLFGAALRQVLKEAGGDDFLATAAFGGMVLCMAAGMAAEGINLAAALRAQDDELTGELAQSLFEISQIFGSAVTAVGLGRVRAGDGSSGAPHARRAAALAGDRDGRARSAAPDPARARELGRRLRARPARPARSARRLSGRLHERLEALVVLVAGGAARQVGVHAGDRAVRVLARHLELDVAVELLEALLAGELRPLGAEQ